ncbi:nuclear transport factor 2 family protein [Pedobacter sp. PAMC26386]|nr:nuclear transport factor 2 family protein [Pedobacter sp. PAMC26386]
MNTSNQTIQQSTEDHKLQIANNFLTALRTQDWNLFRSILTDDCVWTLPGTSIISGEAIGADAVVERGQTIVSFGVSLQLNHILYGLHGVAISIHNQATRNGLVLDEYLAAVCVLRDGKIAAINTHLSDVQGVNAFFTPANII